MSGDVLPRSTPHPRLRTAVAVRAYGRVPRLPVVAWLGNDTGTQDVVASSAEFPLNAR
jgi:hypothetical protein